MPTLPQAALWGSVGSLKSVLIPKGPVRYQRSGATLPLILPSVLVWCSAVKRTMRYVTVPGRGSRTSKRSPLAPSPRPAPLRRPIHRYVAPFVQRVYW